MTATGKVISIHGDIATVQIARTSSCGHNCGECRLCDPGIMQTEALNKIGAVPGDEVDIRDVNSSILRAAFVMYILPVIGMFAVYALSVNFIKNIFISVALIILWIGAWFVYVRSYNKRKIPQNEIFNIKK